ncbi:DUF2779 domain-containing protein [Legionella rowbothamii]|uniref:DUF2779 domain-containing protein n=1 Tax=Legionella rowbothamii TaxID=96229 RepID=UPI001F5F7D16|nr:DUF2779 domain-containing protein [Legionella rowbothamii]
MLLEESVTLFEAAIQYKRYFVRSDILIKDKNHLKLIEVKAKSIDKNTRTKIEKRDGTINADWKSYIADIAFQKWVLQNVYPNYRISSYLMLIDKDSLCPTDGLNQKFILEKDQSGKPCVKIADTLSVEDLSVPLLKEMNVDDLIEKIWNERNEKGIDFKNQFQEFSDYYFSDKKSPPIPKKECAKCQFRTLQDETGGFKSGYKECWAEALQYRDSDFQDATILDLWAYPKKDECLKSGLIKLKDFDESDLQTKSDGKPGLSQSERQWLQIEKVKNADNEVWLDKQGLKDEIASWTYPLHFIDFETAMMPIPFKKGMHPYQGVAFQFSHHIIDQQGNIEHFGEYLNTEPGIDPSIEFVRALKKELEKDTGTIFRYSNHENTYLNFILRQLEEMSEPPPDKEEICEFIKSITKSSGKSREQWEGKRCMVDLWELVKRFYYDPLTKGSNSIKTIFPTIIKRSKFLQEKYSKPIYGSKNGVSSKNFTDQQWIVFDHNEIKDPYSLLAPINKEIPNEKIELLFEDDQLKEGGAATIAYAKLQFTHMSDFERDELRKALLRYCELDTLAMVMIVEAWFDMLV